MEFCNNCSNGTNIVTSPNEAVNFPLLRNKSDCDVITKLTKTMNYFMRYLKTSKKWGRACPKYHYHSPQWIIFYLLFLHLLYLSSNTEARLQAGTKYHWKSGSWGECESTSCGEGGVQLRSVNCVYANKNWLVVHSHCDETIKPIDQRSCFKVCAEHRDKYRWKTGVWQECRLVDSQPVTGEVEDKCGLDFIQIGSQIRNITCVDVDDETEVMGNYVCEKFSYPPDNSRYCDIPCPVNCVTSHWSQWSTCSKSCGNGTQYRTRNVLTKAEYGGSDCPKLSSVRPCPTPPPCDPILVTFFSVTHVLKFGNWTTCKPTKLEVATGRRRSSRKEIRRRLSQVQSSLIGGRGRHVACLNEDGESVGESVMIEETCTVTQHCEVRPWSEWSNCFALCGKTGNRTRTREIKILPSGPAADPCPPTEETKNCDVDLNHMTKCSGYTWVTGGWDQCITIDNATCGGGIQTRYVYCVVRNEFTIYKASTAVALGGNDGLKEWAKLQPVHDSFCNENYKPFMWQECEVLCSGMCEVGEWSDWSECAPDKCHTPENIYFPEPLRTSRKIQKNAFKRRMRKIVEGSDRDGCPHTREVIPCEETRCFHWHPVSTSQCQPLQGECGTGTQDQQIVCRDMWRNIVDAEHCYRKPAAHPINTTLDCFVPCSSDCVVGAWSSWTACTHTCKRGKREMEKQTRFREILANPGIGGKSCPSRAMLQESRSCNQHKCSVYYWDVGPWSVCQVKDSVTPTAPAVGIRTQDMFMADDGNNTSGQHKPFYFPPNDKELVCGVGYQIRTVKCRKKDSGIVQDKLCGSKRMMPLITRDCTFPCPKDCVVSEWGEWTSCERECEKVAKPGQGSQGPVYQERHRVVVQHRTGRGTPCPIEMKQSRRCLETEKCMQFRWRVGKWSECVKIAGASSVYGEANAEEKEVKCQGAMTRKIQCKQYSSSGESMSVELRLCLKYADRSTPESSKHCLIECKADKAFARWREKVGCQADAKKLETIEEIYGMQIKSSDTGLKYITMQKTAKPIGRWSSCNITKEMPSRLLASLVGRSTPQPYCGQGDRQRALACYIEGTDVIVDNSHCQYTEFQKESCEIPCPKDCQLSPWASWGACGDSTVGRTDVVNSAIWQILGLQHLVARPPPCGENLRMRYRFSKSESEHGGRRCPVLDNLGLKYDTELCHTVCDSYYWIPQSWGKCEIDRNGAFSNCGEGYQYREVKCYQTDYASGLPNFANVIEDVRSCDLESMPYGSRRCNVPCPGECVYSKWSSWENCMSTTSVVVESEGQSCSGSRKRTRTVLRKVAPETGFPDSHCDNVNATTQVEPCEININCFTYRSMWTEWGNCILPLGGSCGNGTRERRSNCISSNGLPVHISECVKVNVLVPEPEREPCRVKCSIDCEVSAWCAWSKCGNPCDGAVEQQRTRKIIREPSMLGRPCPVTIETTPCSPKPCHRWILGDWSQCSVPGGNCGTGLQFREVKCTQYDGILVADSLCQSQQGSTDLWFAENQLRKDCQITCAGECHMTQWSQWSECHLRCLNLTTAVSGVTGGVQTRSRVGFIIGQISEIECPPYEIGEQSCTLELAKCFIYDWKTTAKFHKGKRPVWCERTIDKKNVSSGCHERLKLQEELYCKQNCDVIPNSYCSNAGVCKCDSGYQPISHTSGILLSCNETQPNDDARIVKIVKVEAERPDQRSTVRESPTSDDIPLETSSQSINCETTKDIVIKQSGLLDSLGMLTEDGQLKAWVYGVLAGLVILFIFIIALIYLICVTCCRKKQPPSYGLYSTRNIKSRSRKRRNNSSGSNVGVGMVLGMGRFPPANSQMTSSSSRSGFYQSDQYDDVIWKET
ncbi:thrombospondin type-1 domain-containing protein 7A-like isoform X1 [Styela clava]